MFKTLFFVVSLFAVTQCPGPVKPDPSNPPVKCKPNAPNCPQN